MKRPNSTKLLCFAILFLLFCSGAQADLNLADGTASGQWYNPARDGEGFVVEIIGEGDNLQISVTMYSWDESGNQLWVAGNVPISNGDIGATIPVFQVEGPAWGTQGFDPSDRDVTEFGTIAARFPTCDTALFAVQSNVAGLASGNYSTIRLTELVGMDCTDPPPAPEEGEVPSGLWTGPGICFFVNEEGTKIVESDTCEGKAAEAELPGVEVDIDGKVDPDNCVAAVVCEGAWPISYGEDVRASCINEFGGAINFYFSVDNNAWVEVYELGDVGNGRACVSATTATPAE